MAGAHRVLEEVREDLRGRSGGDVERAGVPDLSTAHHISVEVEWVRRGAVLERVRLDVLSWVGSRG